jgi:L-methionine (R)-S-oxide reductase
VAEATTSLAGLSRAEAWDALQADAVAILDGVDDPITAMATMSCLLSQGFGFLWAGFYRVVGPELLRVGPYQGTLGCLEIPFGQGVCGAAAREGRSVLVPDVHAFPGHIACDGRSRSELVVPVRGASGQLIAVLDLDSEHLAHFSEVDVAGAERLVRWFAA